MQEVTIEPVRSRLRPSDVIANAALIRVVSIRDLKARYKQSLLGPVWIIFQPLALLAAYMVGFRGVAHVTTGHAPYVDFALAGITVWAYFQAVATAGTSSIVSNGALVAQTACPRFVFPIASLLSCIPSFLIPCFVSVIGALIAGLESPRWFLLPLPALWTLLVTGGVVAITSSVTVRFRDMIQALPFMLQVGAFLVPVGYPVETLSEKLRILVSLNPLTGCIEAWRWALLDDPHPYLPAIYLSGGVGLLIIILGYRTFARTEIKMADVL